jgi:hypothetical protein
MPGVGVMILDLFSPKKMENKLAHLTQNTAIL